MKNFSFILLFCILFLLITYGKESRQPKPSHRLLQILRILSGDCSFHGYYFQDQCFCEGQYAGDHCETKISEGFYDTDDKCDDLYGRLDHLLNISPDFYPGDDDMFSRFSGKSIGEGEAAYGNKGDTWIKMHDIVQNFSIFNELEPTDIHQGALGDCYLLAAFVSLTTINSGAIIRSVFESTEDNANHVYVTRWLIDGKPRFVAVDDWVPGKDNQTSFASPSNNDVWPVILEKAWAKIHGTFMAIEAGWHTDVWQALTLAPAYDKYHSSKDTPASIFKVIKNLVDKKFPVGSATINVDHTNEVPGHAYSILGAYQVTLDDKTTVQLIRMYNPWNKEVWTNNPWSDNSLNWTDNVKAQVPYVNKNDGIFYVNTADYLANFGATCWAELQPGYDVSFQDIALKPTLSVNIDYTTVFTYNAKDNLQSLYVFIDQSDTRINLGCDNPANVIALVIKGPNGQLHVMDKYGYNVKIVNATSGNYTVTATIFKVKDYIKYLTITIYGPNGLSDFLPLANNEIVYDHKNCPNNCSGNGDCNTFNGVCSCDYLWSGDDCSKNKSDDVVVDPCTGMDCSNQGVCVAEGNCMCNDGFEGQNCEINNNVVVDLCTNQNCSNNGVCESGTGQCFCNDGFSGDNCEIDNNTIVVDLCTNKDCSKNGVCESATGTCFCNDGFSGDDCEISNDICSGVTCSGNGVCNSVDGSCECNFGYLGNECELTDKCQNVTCSGNGKCNADSGKCDCYKGFIGLVCQTIEKCANETCSGNGVCSKKTGECSCNKGFSGVRCQKKDENLCLNKTCSGNGICNKLNGSCLCKSGFNGVNCELRHCKNCSTNGKCNEQNGVCECKPGYSGEGCQNKVQCFESNCSNNGICNQRTGKCACFDGYNGELCNISRCSNNDCSGRGQCNLKTGKCSCYSLQFSGVSCEIVNNCYNQNCSGNGKCNKVTGKCACFDGYNGELCNISRCSNNDCSGRGQCNLKTGKCSCYTLQFSGVSCEIVNNCYNKNCSGKGQCNKVTGMCKCQTGYTGTNCEKSQQNNTNHSIPIILHSVNIDLDPEFKIEINPELLHDAVPEFKVDVQPELENNINSDFKVDIVPPVEDDTLNAELP